ncbi:MAG: DNA topoisomerase, partial [Nanoarchaeota archaeon]
TAQKLYLEGLISYPRTSSQKIPQNINAKKILKSLEKNFPQVKEVSRTNPIEGKKTDPAHPSIYPTGEFKKLADKESKLYDLIVKRFISVFCRDAQTENKKVTIASISPKTKEEILFCSSGLKVLDKGWTNVYPLEFKESIVPELKGKVKIDEIKFAEKETQPPKRYTPASLISLLEKKNLGTKTTRSLIIDTLFDRGYLDGDSNIKATHLGIKLIESLEKYSPIIIDENLTNKLEDEMEQIQNINSKENKQFILGSEEKRIIEETKRIITDISKDFKTKEKEIGASIMKGIEVQRETQKENSKIMRCLKCNIGDLRIIYSKKTSRSFIGCSNYPNCKQTFSLPPQSLIKRTEEDCPECRFPKLLSIKKGRKPWKFCFNPECPANKKRIEEYRAKKAEQETI